MLAWFFPATSHFIFPVMLVLLASVQWQNEVLLGVCARYRLGYANKSSKCPVQQASPCQAQESSPASPGGSNSGHSQKAPSLQLLWC